MPLGTVVKYYARNLNFARRFETREQPLDTEVSEHKLVTFLDKWIYKE